nr:ATP synthase F0 subunit 8 [Diplonevra concinna]
MPQMAPISWLLMFLIFIITFILFNIMNYFMFTYNEKSNISLKIFTKSMNWKW